MHHFLGLKHKHQRDIGAVETPANEESHYVRALDKTTFVAGVLGPFTVLPQIWQIFSTHSASGVSSMSWLLMFIVTFPWVFYGIAHKEKSIIVSFILWEVVNALVFIGALMYGGALSF